MYIWLGIAFIVLVLEAARRSTGLIMPIVAVIFLGYALFGEALPPPWTHRNYEVDRLVGQLYITLEGIFRSEEHTSELQSLMRISYAVFCLKKKNNQHDLLPIIYNHRN